MKQEKSICQRSRCRKIAGGSVSRRIIALAICFCVSISIALGTGGSTGYPARCGDMCIPDCPKKPHDCYSCEGNRITQNLNQNVFGLNSFGGFVTGPGGLTYLPQNGINIANANGYNNQIDQNMNQNGLGLSGFGGGFGIGGGFGGLTYLPQTGINIANANSGCAQTECRKKSCGFTSCSDGRSCHHCGGNQINQNLNQNGLGLTGFGSLGTGFGGFAYLPQNGINIANANGWNNQINQNLNQNAFGS